MTLTVYLSVSCLLWLCLPVALCLPVSPSLSLSLCLSRPVCLSVWLTDCLSVCLLPSLSLSLCRSLSPCLPLSFSVSFFLSFSLAHMPSHCLFFSHFRWLISLKSQLLVDLKTYSRGAYVGRAICLTGKSFGNKVWFVRGLTPTVHG